ncbi:MAG: SDR family oxidoreductase [Pseudomonadota bacterium]
MQKLTAIVTGAASGIGEATVARLLADGYDVCAFDIDAAGLQRLKAQSPQGSALTTVAGDVCSASAWGDLRQQWSQMHGGSRLHVLVSCAGLLRVGSLADTSEDDWDQLFEVNVKGTFLALRTLTPLMKSTGTDQRRASVIVVTSAAAVRPKIGGGLYAATKAALAQTVKVWAVELAQSGINVNALAPGTVNTPMASSLGSVKGNFALSGVSPMGRMAEARDIADAISLLYDERARFITGASLAVDGGLTAAFVPAPGMAAATASQQPAPATT